MDKFFSLINKEGCIPGAWKEGYSTPFYENKGDVRDYRNYRGVKMTSHILKYEMRFELYPLLDIFVQ